MIPLNYLLTHLSTISLGNTRDEAFPLPSHLSLLSHQTGAREWPYHRFPSSWWVLNSLHSRECGVSTKENHDRGMSVVRSRMCRPDESISCLSDLVLVSIDQDGGRKLTLVYCMYCSFCEVTVTWR